MKYTDPFLDRRAQRSEEALWVGRKGQHDSVVCSHYKASEVGRSILAQGGNAVDAAIGVSCALGVVEPAGSGLGGMTMALVHIPGEESHFYEGGCRAPSGAKPEQLQGVNRKFGYPAIAVPMNPATLHHLYRQWGKLSLETILSPVIKLCKEGAAITPFQHRLIKEYYKGISRGNGSKVLLDAKGNVPESGTILCNPDLGETFIRMMQHGFDEFYLGETGARIVEDMQHNGGFLTVDDFNPLPVPQELKPIEITIGDRLIHTSPPPAGGFTLVQMLLLFEKMKPAHFDPDSLDGYRLVAHIIRSCRMDRRKNRLMSIENDSWRTSNYLTKEYIEKRSRELHDELRRGETTHFNVVDASGMIVSITQSIERSFGSKIVTPGLGFLYNGFMQGFKIEATKHPHYLRPGAVARSNASPTIVFEGGNPRYVIGSTGSERMISGIFQVLIRLYYGQSPYEAVAAPRIHCNPDGELFGEFGRMSPEVVKGLSEEPLTLIPYAEDWAFSAGGLNLTVIEPDGTSFGISDPRRDGLPL